MKAVLKGIGAIGGFGFGINELHNVLEGGSMPAGSWVDIDVPEGTVQVPGLLANTDHLSNFIPLRALRRMDHHTRLAVLAALTALEDADMLQSYQRGRMGIIVATGYGATCNNFDFQKLSHDDSDFIGSPMVFINSVHNAAAAYIAIALKENGPNLTISQYDMSFPSAVISAIQWLREDRVDRVLVGGLDDFSNAAAFELYTRYPDSEKKNPQLLLDSSKHLLVGEGACFFVLSREKGDVNNEYGYIENLFIGRRYPDEINLPNTEAYILPGDCMEKHREIIVERLTSHARFGSYTHLFGLMPISESFDLAIAALSFKHRKWFPPFIFRDKSDRKTSNHMEPPKQLPGHSICCFKLGVENTMSWITLQKK